MTDSRLTRRGSLVRLGGLLATAVGAAGLKIETSEGAGPAAVASGDVTCVLTPERRKARTTSRTKPCAATSPTVVRVRRSC